MTSSSNGSGIDPFSMIAKLPGRGSAPVHLWDPPFCGDIDMRIAADGTWFHEGRPIRRMPLVQLFSSVLKREGDSYFLVTPHEKVGIQVEDCPFLIVSLDCREAKAGQELVFTTQTGEEVRLDASHPLRVEAGRNEEPHPVIEVRDGLWGLLNRAVFYQLVDLAETDATASTDIDAGSGLFVRSAGQRFSLG